MIKRVLLGIGGTPFTNVAIQRAVELCKIHNAQLTAATVVDERRLSDASIYCRQHGFEPELKYRPGSPGEEILAEAAEWDADMIVLSMSRASVFSRAVFGATALHVLRNADRPLFFGR